MKLLLLVFLCTLSILHANVFEKYIQLKRSLKQAQLPAHQAIPQSSITSSVDSLTGKTEQQMRAEMLAKPSNTTRKHKQTKYASGHTFIPSVHTNTTWHSSNVTKPSPTPQKQLHHIEQPTIERPVHQDFHKQEVLDAVVGQGARTGHEIHHEHVKKNPWSGSKAVPVVVISVLIWACAIASKKTSTRRKARVLKKRLTNPRMVA